MKKNEEQNQAQKRWKLLLLLLPSSPSTTSPFPIVGATASVMVAVNDGCCWLLLVAKWIQHNTTTLIHFIHTQHHVTLEWIDRCVCALLRFLLKKKSFKISKYFTCLLITTERIPFLYFFFLLGHFKCFLFSVTTFDFFFRPSEFTFVLMFFLNPFFYIFAFTFVYNRRIFHFSLSGEATSPRVFF